MLATLFTYLQDRWTIRRLRRLIAIFGARTERWPQQDRDRFPAMKRHPALAQILSEAEALDALLDQLTSPEPSSDLHARIMSDWQRQVRPMASFQVPHEPLAAPRQRTLRAPYVLASLGLAMSVGAALNFTAVPAQPPEDELIAYLASASFALETYHDR